MADRPYTLLSCSMSIDGYIDGTTESRLLLSNDLDFDRVDEVRAGVDAILVGATTVRNDNPRLRVRDAERRRTRCDRGLPEHPLKVTVTRRGRLDPSQRFFADDGTRKLVYANTRVVEPLSARLGGVSEVVDGGDPVRMEDLVRDLHVRGVRRLMVEGGGTVHTQFLAADLVDELQLVVAPFFVGDSGARRFVGEGRYPWHPGRRATLAETRQLGDVVLLRYALSDRFAPTD
ncbi:MAG TPA: dihydrofolate reductase family protein [Nocardioides sp.]|uniref:RibD family protein n=1 Tax=Nocardioides sp. TaxID=35761 RepID=UPI002F3E36B6